MFIPHHTLVAAPDATPRCWMLILHGIFGRGTNWRSFASKLVERRPDWGTVLVDVRMHGRSQDAPPPHTVAAAAADLDVLCEALEDRSKLVRAVCGHSFGGKVALSFRHRPAGSELIQTWLLDSTPGRHPVALDAPDNTVVAVLRMLQRLPARFDSRAQFVTHVTDQGFAPALGHWLAMNLDRSPSDSNQAGASGSDTASGLQFRLDADAMAALLGDYYQIDAWPWLASGPGSAQVVVAGGSDTISADDLARLHTLEAEGASVRTQVIPGASHWLHVDALDALLDIVAAGLP